MLNTTRDRIKNSGLEAFSKHGVEESVEAGLKFLECTVVPELPLLWMRSTSLTHGAVMLYDGETYVFSPFPHFSVLMHPFMAGQ